MTDEIDKANEVARIGLEAAIENASADIPKGKAGDCELCGEWFGRLVGGACVPCRMKYKLD